LLNEEELTGTYEIEFDGSNLASRIYFYKMSAGNYSNVKKVLKIVYVLYILIYIQEV